MIAFGVGLLTAVLCTLMLLTSVKGSCTINTDEQNEDRRVHEIDAQIHPVTACAVSLLLIVIWTLTIALLPGVRPW